VVELLLDADDVGAAVAGGFQFVGDVGVGAHQGNGRLVERDPLRLTVMTASFGSWQSRALIFALPGSPA
jgi:hypothetical protein